MKRTSGTRRTPRVASRASRSVPALEENVEVIKRWERALASHRSRVEQLGDWVTRVAASGPALVGHAVWFAGWIVVNLGLIPRLRPFDPFPYQFLTMVVSLEAIFLALLVLASQNRLARQTDKREILDLQTDLLAEREMSAVLQLLQDIAAHLRVKETLTLDQIRDLAQQTDIRELAERAEEIADGEQKPATSGKAAEAARRARR